jgi:hypothetical protein
MTGQDWDGARLLHSISKQIKPLQLCKKRYNLPFSMVSNCWLGIRWGVN